MSNPSNKKKELAENIEKGSASAGLKTPINMRKTIITFIFALFALSSTAQKLPDWIINNPSPTNNTYLYVMESVTGQMK